MCFVYIFGVNCDVFCLPAPVSYIDLLNLLADHSEDDQITILERMRKCNHPSLAEGNNTKLEVCVGSNPLEGWNFPLRCST